MIEKVKRTERGWAGHFICSDNCKFRRNTLLEYKDKKWIVSTVGAMLIYNPITKKTEYDTVGCGRYYETMAFEAKQEKGVYWDIDVEKPIDFESEWALTSLTYESDQRANDMHERVVEELIQKIQKDCVNESFDCGYHEHAKEKHDERVADTPNRIAFALEQFNKYNIYAVLKNKATGHFHCWRKSDKKLFQFYAGTGKIVGENKRGIHALIEILTK